MCKRASNSNNGYCNYNIKLTIIASEICITFSLTLSLHSLSLPYLQFFARIWAYKSRTNITMQFILQMQLWNNWNHKAAQLYQIIVRSGFSGQSLATSEFMDRLVYATAQKVSLTWKYTTILLEIFPSWEWGSIVLGLSEKQSADYTAVLRALWIWMQRMTFIQVYNYHYNLLCSLYISTIHSFKTRTMIRVCFIFHFFYKHSHYELLELVSN